MNHSTFYHNFPRLTLCMYVFSCIFLLVFIVLCWIRIYRATFSTHFCILLQHTSWIRFETIFQFCSVLFCFVLLHVSFLYIFFFSLFLFLSFHVCFVCSFSWNPLETIFYWEPKKHNTTKLTENEIKWKSHDKYWLNETKMLVELFSSENKKKLKNSSFFFRFFVFLFMGCPIDKNDLFYFTFYVILNYWIFMFESTMKMVENWRKQIHIGFFYFFLSSNPKKTWHVP